MLFSIYYSRSALSAIALRLKADYDYKAVVHLQCKKICGYPMVLIEIASW